VLTLLKTASATASEPATEDQASDHSHQSHPERVEFDLNVVEDAPTTDQLRSILDYVGGKNAGEVIRGARDEADAMKKLQENKGAFQRPLVNDFPPVSRQHADKLMYRLWIGITEKPVRLADYNLLKVMLTELS
jgi:hypothetical protein